MRNRIFLKFKSKCLKYNKVIDGKYIIMITKLIRKEKLNAKQ